MSDDLYDLARFVTAQDGVQDVALAELTAGRKRSHWMWFIFPQMRGLGGSAFAVHFGIGSLDEARAYLAHPLLGPRLDAVTRAVLRHGDRSLHEIFGAPDDRKFRSSMTLFARAGGGDVFADALATFCGGVEDEATLRLIGLTPRP